MLICDSLVGNNAARTFHCLVLIDDVVYRKANKMDKPLVSLIVTVFNTERYIRECLESICNQTYRELEVIVVDDGSTDNSPSICDEYREKNNFFTVVHKINEGVSVARNVGIDNAHGKYITFIDGDDVIEANFCKILADAADKNNADIVICDYKSFNSINERISSFAPSLKDKQEYKRELILRTLYREYGGHIKNSVVSAGVTWGKFYNLDFIRKENSRFIPGLVRAQDTVFWLNTVIKTDNIVHVNVPLYCYRLNEQSVCGGSRYFANSEQPFGMLLDEYSKFIKQNNLGDDFIQAYYCRVIEVLFWHWKHNYFNSQNKKNVILRTNEFCKLLSNERYKEAIRFVDTSHLSRRQKGLVIAFRYHMAHPYIVGYRVLEKIKGLRK